MVVEVFVAQNQTKNALPDQGLHAMLDQARVTPIRKASRKSPRQPQPMVDLSRQQHAAVRRDGPAIELRYHRSPPDSFKLKQLRGTLPVLRGSPRIEGKLLLHNHFR